MHKTNTITYANILSLGMNQIQNSNSQKNKVMTPKFEGTQNLVAWAAAPVVILGTMTYFPYGL